MSKLVRDLFELAKMEEGKIALVFEEVDLVEVVENALLKTRMKAQAKEIQVEFNQSYDIPSIDADGLRMEQVLMNLIENAIRYTEKGQVKIHLTSVSGTVKVMVEDTGIGIPPVDVPFLFERFYRIEKSRVGKGTSFEMEFPVAKGDAL